MNENLKKFMQTAATDEEILTKLQQAASPEEAYKIASGVSGGYTYDEFVAGMKSVNDSLTKANDGELSDDDLAIVAGGKDGQKVFDNVTVSVSALSGIATGVASAVTAAASAAATAAS